MGTALPFALGALDMDPAHAGTVVNVIMDVIGVVIICAVCEVALRDQNGTNSGAMAKALSWLAKNVVGGLGAGSRAPAAGNCGGGGGGGGSGGGGGVGSGGSGGGSGVSGVSPKSKRGDGGAPIL